MPQPGVLADQKDEALKPRNKLNQEPLEAQRSDLCSPLSGPTWAYGRPPMMIRWGGTPEACTWDFFPEQAGISSGEFVGTIFLPLIVDNISITIIYRYKLIMLNFILVDYTSILPLIIGLSTNQLHELPHPPLSHWPAAPAASKPPRKLPRSRFSQAHWVEGRCGPQVAVVETNGLVQSVGWPNCGLSKCVGY